MLLSMFVSFLLARKFGGKKYVLLMTTYLALVSLLSVGLVFVTWGHDKYYGPRFPLPLSFPFHATYYHTVQGGQVIDNVTTTYSFQPYYGLFFFTLKIESFPFGSFSFGDLMLVHSFFALDNLLGAILGFWIKTRRR